MLNIMLLILALSVSIGLSYIVITLSSKLDKDETTEKIITYEKHLEVLDNMQWEYDRKLKAYQMLMISIFFTLPFVFISIYLSVVSPGSIVFHIITAMTLIHSVYFNYKNRDALFGNIKLAQL